MSVRHPRLRRLRLRLTTLLLGGHFDNERRCGCVDYHPRVPRYPRQAGLAWSTRFLSVDPHFGPTFYLFACDSCRGALRAWRPEVFR